MKFETIALHGGQTIDQDTLSRAVPVYRTSSYVFKSTEHAANHILLLKIAAEGVCFAFDCQLQRGLGLGPVEIRGQGQDRYTRIIPETYPKGEIPGVVKHQVCAGILVAYLSFLKVVITRIEVHLHQGPNLPGSVTCKPPQAKADRGFVAVLEVKAMV